MFSKVLCHAMLLASLAGFIGCEKTRRYIVGFFSFDEESAQAVEKHLKPHFTGVDKKRSKIRSRLTLVSQDIAMPTDIQALPLGSTRPGWLAILQKNGAAVLLNPKTGEHRPWLKTAVKTESELGLLGLAFHPKFAQNRRFFLNHNPKDGKLRTVVEEWTWPRDGAPRARRVILTVHQPYQNHNAGQLAFGPDGLLYIGFGDGGWADDPHDHGQNHKTFLGSMLRIDIDRKKPYSIPADNPFGTEVWAYGLRNPWRYTFDPKGRMIVGDVGQNEWEEVTFLAKGDNAGWKTFEGRSCFVGDDTCQKIRSKARKPLWVYGRREGGSITGGLVVSDRSFPKLLGRYIFGDYNSGRIWAIELPGDIDKPAKSIVALGTWPLRISSFGEDHDGRVYVSAFAKGAIYRLEK